MEYVFVYGTLKKGQPNHHILDSPGCYFIGEASLPTDQWEMYNLGAYPAITMATGPCEKIRGEVYEVDEKTFNKLDWLEGYPDLYDRAWEVIEYDSPKELDWAWVYYMPKAPTRRTPILDGVW